MKRLMHLAELLIRDVRVDLRGRDGRVTEHGLHAPDVRAVHEEIRGERVAERVRRNLLRDARGNRIVADEPFDGPRRDGTRLSFSPLRRGR